MAVHPRPADVGKCVKRALRRGAADAVYGVQPRHDDVAPLLELGDHLVRVVLRPAQRLQRRHLREARGAGYAVGYQARHRLDQLERHDAVAHAPARHGVGLGEAVQDDAALAHVGEAGDGFVFAFVQKAAVNLIGKHRNVAAFGEVGERFEIVFGDDGAAWVVGGVYYHQPRSVGDALRHFVHVYAEPSGFVQLHRDGDAAAEVDHGLVDGKAGVGIEDFVSHVHQRHDDEEHDGLAARRDDDVLAFDGYSARRGHLFGDSISQLVVSGRGVVAGEPVGEGAPAGVHHVGGRVEVRFAYFEMNNVHPLAFEPPRLGENLEGGLGAKAIHSAGKSHCQSSRPS